MNWYKQAQQKETKNIVFDIYTKITNAIGGSWVVKDDKDKMKTYKLQLYKIMHIDGKDVKLPGDYFWVEVKIFVVKALNILHPYAGTYENAQNWQQGIKSDLKEIAKKQNKWPKEEEHKRWQALERLQPEDYSTYDEQYGNKLITFDVLVYGKKPDGKEYPAQVNKIEALFGDGDVDKIGSSHSEFNTPTEISQYVKNVIDKYYDEGEDNDEDLSPQPDQPVESINYNPQLANV